MTARDLSPNPPIPRADRRHRANVPEHCKNCGAKHYSRGFCRNCYARWYTTGSPLGGRNIRKLRLENIEPAPSVRYQRWTPEEMNRVMDLRRQKHTVAEIAKLTGRTVNSVQCMLYRVSAAWIASSVL